MGLQVYQLEDKTAIRESNTFYVYFVHHNLPDGWWSPLRRAFEESFIRATKPSTVGKSLVVSPWSDHLVPTILWDYQCKKRKLDLSEVLPALLITSASPQSFGNKFAVLGGTDRAQDRLIFIRFDTSKPVSTTLQLIQALFQNIKDQKAIIGFEVTRALTVGPGADLDAVMLENCNGKQSISAESVFQYLQTGLGPLCIQANKAPRTQNRKKNENSLISPPFQFAPAEQSLMHKAGRIRIPDRYFFVLNLMFKQHQNSQDSRLSYEDVATLFETSKYFKKMSEEDARAKVKAEKARIHQNHLFIAYEFRRDFGKWLKRKGIDQTFLIRNAGGGYELGHGWHPGQPVIGNSEVSRIRVKNIDDFAQPQRGDESDSNADDGSAFSEETEMSG